MAMTVPAQRLGSGSVAVRTDPQGCQLRELSIIGDDYASVAGCILLISR